MERRSKRGNPKGDKTNSIKERRPTGDYIANHGYVLIFSLWVIVLFGFIALSFTRNTSVAIKTETAYTEHIKSVYAARGACIYATRKLLATGRQEVENEDEDEDFKKLTKNELISTEEDRLTSKLADIKKKGIIASTRPWVPRSRPYSLKIGDTNCNVFIYDESGKININKITDENKVNFVKFLTSYTIDELTAETITDSILDWIDSDDLHHINGAEKDYYASLAEPYEPKNGPFESIEELTLVKGVTPRIFELIRDSLTIYGTGKINVNFASREVLTHIPLITREAADAIILLREEQRGIQKIDFLKDILGKYGIVGKDFQKIMNYLTVSYSNYMTIYAIASADKVRGSYKIVVQKGVNECKIIAVYP
ncbi:MAG: hypothetical protein E3K32_03240 [wastewater metagenome]|nr:hypothetical protein [Candidatus Loosdrechtia aerotolerans]